MSARVTGSFRDPSGYVFVHEGRIFRAVDARCQGVLNDLAGAGLLEKLIRDRQVVATHWVEDAGLLADFRPAHPDAASILEHERLAHITFPYEWTVSMLADAALLTLDMQIALVGQGFALKDATAYNIQFRAGRPVFIDLSSIERPKRLDVWFALGQFQRHFLFPLLLAVKRGWDLRSYFLGNLDGIGPVRVLANFRGLGKWAPGILFDVTLPALLENKSTAGKGKTWETAKEKPVGEASAQLLNLKRLGRKIAGLASSYSTSGAWHDYTATCTYDDAAESSKRQHIAAFLGKMKPRTVLDFGCNTGAYSYLAAEQGCTVIAADADHDAAELLHRRLREKPANITAMVVDAANPSPALGYMNTERASFLERFAGVPDCVFALALIHHLLVSANLSLILIRDLFANLTARWLILEFVPTNDVQFQRLLRYRENLFDGITLEACLEVIGKSFTVLAQQSVTGTGRTLLFLEKRA